MQAKQNLKNNKTTKEDTASKKSETKPDERSGIHVGGFIKVFDPNSKEVFVETRT